MHLELHLSFRRARSELTFQQFERLADFWGGENRVQNHQISWKSLFSPFSPPCTQTPAEEKVLNTETNIMEVF